MDSEFMQAIATGLSDKGIEVIRFDFDYMQKAKALNKKRPPDRLDKLQGCFLQQLQSLTDDVPLFIGGKSMGGRVASTLLGQSMATGAIVFGYPFHPPGKPDKLRTEHLQTLSKPMLVLQGERDTFGRQSEVREYALSQHIQLAFLADGDHSFKPRKASGISYQSNMQRAIDSAATFIQANI